MARRALCNFSPAINPPLEKLLLPSLLITTRWDYYHAKQNHRHIGGRQKNQCHQSRGQFACLHEAQQLIVFRTLETPHHRRQRIARPFQGPEAQQKILLGLRVGCNVCVRGDLQLRENHVAHHQLGHVLLEKVARSKAVARRQYQLQILMAVDMGNFEYREGRCRYPVCCQRVQEHRYLKVESNPRIKDSSV